MCGTPKTNMSATISKTPFRSFMATMSLAQRKRFAEVANRAEERREIRENYQRQITEKDKLNSQHRAKPSLLAKLKSWCDQTVKLMG